MQALFLKILRKVQHGAALNAKIIEDLTLLSALTLRKVTHQLYYRFFYIHCWSIVLNNQKKHPPSYTIDTPLQ